MVRAFVGTTIIACLLMVSIFMSVNANASEQMIESTLTIHDAIKIDGDIDFTAPNGVSSGSGTVSDPYIIEGWEIDGTTTGYGIKIENTTKHCIIRNCEIFNSTKGMSFENILNITINACELYDSNIGIYLENTNNNSIGNCTSNGNSIYIESSEDCLIYNNSITESDGNGLYVDSYCSRITISNNYIANNSMNGICIDASNNITIIENEITENGDIGIVLDGLTTTDCVIHHNTIFDNVNKQAQEDTTNSNYWDDGEEGNWWGDYTGVDCLMPYGIGDTPYHITNSSGITVNYDRHPLVERYRGLFHCIMDVLISLMALLILLLIFKRVIEEISGVMSSGKKKR